MRKTEFFEPKNPPECLKELSAEILADLHDLASKYGDLNSERNMRLLSSETPRPFYVTAVVKPGNLNMLVSSMSGFSTIRAEHARSFLLSDPLPSAVIWDITVTAEDAREFIAGMDAHLREIGAIDPETGERLAVEKDDSYPVNRVIRISDIFTGSGVVVQVPEMTNPEEFRRRFDRPEELHLVVTGIAKYGFVHKKDRKFVKMADAIRKVVDRWGISDPGTVTKLPKGQLDKFMAEVADELYSEN